MRRIHFNEETIQEIRSFIEEGHSVKETCNRFTLKYDTLKRVMFENNIIPQKGKIVSAVSYPDNDTVQLICSLYKCTKMRMQDIVKEVKLENFVVQKVIDDNFSEQYQNDRKSKLYSKSKRGVVDDGQGYLMVKKPEWYTGRKGSDYVFQHSVVMCQSLGLTELPKGFVVHHIDGNKHNNNIDNLALLTISGQGSLHSMYNKMCKVQRLSAQE